MTQQPLLFSMIKKDTETEQAMRNRAEVEKVSIRVAVRIRPLNTKEASGKPELVVVGDRITSVVTLNEPMLTDLPTPRPLAFQFDSVFSSFGCPDRFGRVAGGQLEVYEVIGRPLVLNAFKGYNSCLFAYGQTGSGKTYTMMGGDTNSLDGDDSGVMPRLCRELFETLARVEAEGHSRWRVLVGYVEVYNERVSDLLAKRRRGAKEDVFVDVREHPTRGVFIEGQQLPEVSTVREVLDLVEVGNGIRHTAATKMNERSSRSHAIFMFLLHEERSMQTATGQAITTAGMNSRINLVDLAGSERVAQSEVVGQRFNETRYINLSLTTLGRVIDMLAEMATNKNSQWSTPPYRDSKLTYILKDSFGGNSKTFMIATVSPSALNYEETLSTLRYASRARDIVNVTRVNEDPRARRIRELEEQIVRMRCDIEGKDPSYVAGLEEKLVLLEAEAQKRAADLQALEKEREKNEIHERMLRATEAMREQLAVKAGELQLQVEESRRLAEYHQSVNKSLKEEHACRERDLLEQLRGHDAEVDCIRRNNNMEFLNCQEELRRTVGDLEHERQEREVVLVQLAHRQEELKIAIQSSQQSMQVRDELLRQNSVLVVRIQEIESQNKSQQRLQHDLERFRMEHMRQEMIVQLLQAQLEEMTLRYELSSQYSVVEREVYSTWMSGLHARITLDVERQLNMYAERRNHEQLTDAMCFGSVITNIEEKGQEKERQEMLREEEIKCKGEQHEKEQKVEQVHRNIQIMGKRDTENDAHGQKKINHIEKERVKLQGHVTSIRSDMGEQLHALGGAKSKTCYCLGAVTLERDFIFHLLCFFDHYISDFFDLIWIYFFPVYCLFTDMYSSLLSNYVCCQHQISFMNVRINFLRKVCIDKCCFSVGEESYETTKMLLRKFKH